jgi:hypothetical protein
VASFLIFVIVGIVPLAIYLINSLIAMRDKSGGGGIAAGIPKPKQAKQPKNRTREARVRQRRAVYCGRHFTHMALALMGSQDSCKHCTYLQEVPPPPSAGPDDDDSDRDSVDDIDAAVRAAEEIIDRANH